MVLKAESAQLGTYGVCSNPRCRVSSLRPELDKLYGLLDEIDLAIQHQESFDSMLPPVEVFVPYFQNAEACVHCGKPVERNRRSVTGITDPEEKARIELTNEALHGLRELQALGVLPDQNPEARTPANSSDRMETAPQAEFAEMTRGSAGSTFDPGVI